MKTQRFSPQIFSLACVLAILLTLVPSVSAANAPGSTDTFFDVQQGQWFKPYVEQAAGAGLMSGVGGGAFSPEGSLTLAQTMVLAYQIHSRANSGGLPQAAGAWYMPYYQYCLDNGIVSAAQTATADLNRAATRFEMVSILDKAVPDSRMTAINPLPDGFIPDLAESAPYGAVVYKWYRAGVLTGDSQHRFNGSSRITRAEVSVILCQLTGLVDRVKLEAAPDLAAQEMAEEVVRLVNEERAKAGLPALTADTQAAQAAQVRAQELLQHFDHTRPDGRSCFTALDEAGLRYSSAGENIAMGYRTPEDVMTAWMSSPDHRSNILNPDYTSIGVGFASGYNWVQLFTASP